MFEKIYYILVQILGESKQGGYDRDIKNFQFNCPQCAEENGGIPDNKYNLEVSFQKMLFHCWRCGETDSMRGTLGYLIKRYGGRRLYMSYKEEMTALRNSRMYSLDYWDEAPIENFETHITLPPTFSKILLSRTSLDKRLTDYLEKRKIDQKIIDKFNLGYTGWIPENRKWSNRLIIPSYDGYGELNFWTGRDFTGNSFTKYCNCDAVKKDIIFQESLIHWDQPIYLVEGAIDCLYLNNAIALLGKSLKKDSAIYKALVQKSNSEIVICLDGDTKDYETKKIYRTLNFGRLKERIRYIWLGDERIPYKDFGEVYEAEGKKGIIDIIRTKKKYEEIELLS